MLLSLDRPGTAARAVWVGVVVAGLILIWQWLAWLSRLYVLTSERMMCVAGVMLQSVADVPLRNVCNLVVVRGAVERVLGLGTLGAATAGTDGYELVWVLLSRPEEVLAAVRRAVDGQQQGEEQSMSRPPVSGREGRRLVIGLVGACGGGERARGGAGLLGERGYVVIDSDKEAKAALDRPEVREELVKWWGPKVLAEGRIDRRAVAGIIFSDEAERLRLERLVHPLVKADRAALIERATGEGRAGVVVDALLLIEAGVHDKE